MKIVDIANEIYRELGEPSTTSIPAIAFWVRSNIGALNNYLNESFTINDSYEIVDPNLAEINIQAVAVLKKMYSIHDYDLKIRANIYSITTSDIISISDKGRSITKVNKNEVTKAVTSLKNEEEKNLQALVVAYKNRDSTPIQVVGDDTVVGSYNRYNTYTNYNRLIK